MSIARDIIEPKYWHDGYSPHPTLTAQPVCFGDLLDGPALTEPPQALAPPVSAVAR